MIVPYLQIVILQCDVSDCLSIVNITNINLIILIMNHFMEYKIYNHRLISMTIGMNF